MLLDIDKWNATGDEYSNGRLQITKKHFLAISAYDEPPFVIHTSMAYPVEYL
jgi:hypothetical protein